MEAGLNIAVCDDNPADVQLLLACIAQSGIPAKSHAFSSGEALLEAFLPGKYDLIFLDIYMEGMRGIAAAAHIRQQDRAVMLAFTTTSQDHALESYRLKAIGYLEKPLRTDEVREMLALAHARQFSAQSITLLIDGKNRRVIVDHILYFEQRDHAVLVVTAAEVLRTSQKVKLAEIELMLPDSFFRCHHSYIVNLAYVSGIDRALKTFYMHNGEQVHIRHQTLKKAVDAHESYLFRAAREDKGRLF